MNAIALNNRKTRQQKSVAKTTAIQAKRSDRNRQRSEIIFSQSSAGKHRVYTSPVRVTHTAQRGSAATKVAQSCTLPYRRFAIGYVYDANRAQSSQFEFPWLSLLKVSYPKANARNRTNSPPMCTCVQLRAPTCGKMKNFENGAQAAQNCTNQEWTRFLACHSGSLFRASEPC